MTIGREDVIVAIIESEVLDSSSNVRDDVKLTDQGVDSLGMFNILLVLAERYDMEIPDRDAERLQTVDQIVAYFNQRLG